MDPSLVQFYRQYLQQLNELCYPSAKVFLNPYVQEQIFRYMFDDTQKSHLPPVNYQRRVLKSITEKIESAIEDPEKDEISDNLMQHMAYLSTLSQPPAVELAQQKTIVSYFLPETDHSVDSTSVLIEEARNLLTLGSNVGFRTWDACLRLAYYLTTSGRSFVEGKNVIELGAGTGLLSILCGQHLGANRVLATDGVADVVTSINRNIQLNSASQANSDSVVAKILDWTDLCDLSSTLDPSSDSTPPSDLLLHQPSEYHTILGSDITYNLDYFIPLVETLASIQTLYPNIAIIISCAIRNLNTFNAFIKACSDKDFDVEEIPFECPPFHQQKGFFHTIALPIKIVRIVRRREGDGS